MRTRTIIIAIVAVAIVGVIAYILLSKPAEETYYPTQGWRTSTPEEQGMDSAVLADMLDAVREQEIRMDSLLVMRNGTVVLDAYHYPYDGSVVHDVASVTKSVTSTLIGIAVEQGLIDLDKPVLSYFPDRTIANLDERKQSMTVRHLTQMRNGFESGCLEGDPPTVRAMMDQPDYVQWALDRPMVAEPGTEWCYDSPGMHLLSAILQQESGMTELEFARANLFTPLGISELAWDADPQGYTHGWGDLHLKPADMAKLGYLWLNEGNWNGVQVVPAAYVKGMTKAYSDFGGGDGYGMGMWTSDGGGFEASGRGGQAVKVAPPYNAIVVTTGGGFEYDDIDSYLLKSVVDLENPLPANPDGVARLEEAKAALVSPPAAQPVPPLPELAATLAGKTFTFEPNPIDLKAVSLDFSKPEYAMMLLDYFSQDAQQKQPVGLDGIFRLGDTGAAAHGVWEDETTFLMDYYDIDTLQIRVRFDGDQAFLSVPGRVSEIIGTLVP